MPKHTRLKKLIKFDNMETNNLVMAVPSESSFKLSKVQLQSNESVKVNYEICESVGGVEYTNKYKIESTKEIHPDMKHLFDCLADVLADTCNVYKLVDTVCLPKFEATEEQRTIAREELETITEGITVKSVTLSGKDDNIGCIISGEMEVKCGLKATIITPRLKYNEEVFGFEHELGTMLMKLQEEIYAYLFKGKRAQLELFGADGEADPQFLREKRDEANPD